MNFLKIISIVLLMISTTKIQEQENEKPAGPIKGAVIKGGRPPGMAEKTAYNKLLDSLTTVTIQGLPNPTDQINGGPYLISSPVIDCICTETHWGTCDSDWGEVCGCSGYSQEKQNHGIFFIPKLISEKRPYLIYQVQLKNENQLTGKSLTILTEIKLPKAIADTIGVEDVYISPGIYTFSKGNAVSLPVKLTMTPNSAYYHAINEKGLPGTKTPNPCHSCGGCCVQDSKGFHCCTN